MQMLKGAKLRSQLFDILGVRVILTNRQPHEIMNSNYGSSSSSSSREVNGSSSGYKSTATIDIGGSKLSPSENDSEDCDSQSRTAAATAQAPIDAELLSVHRIHTLISQLSKWVEDKSRFKDYVSYPKPGG
jgi:hypothetical protein